MKPADHAPPSVSGGRSPGAPSRKMIGRRYRLRPYGYVVRRGRRRLVLLSPLEVLVLAAWGPGGMRNVLVELPDGSTAVTPWRRLRKATG